MNKVNPFKHPKSKVEPAFNVTSEESITTSDCDKSALWAKSLFKQKTKPSTDAFQVSYNETLKNVTQSDTVESTLNMTLSKSLDSEDLEVTKYVNRTNPFKRSLKNIAKKAKLEESQNALKVSFMEEEDVDKSTGIIRDVIENAEKSKNSSIDKSLLKLTDQSTNSETNFNQSSFNDENLNGWMSDQSDEEILSLSSRPVVTSEAPVPPPSVPPVTTSDEELPGQSTTRTTTSDEEILRKNIPTDTCEEELPLSTTLPETADNELPSTTSSPAKIPCKETTTQSTPVVKFNEEKKVSNSAPMSEIPPEKIPSAILDDEEILPRDSIKKSTSLIKNKPQEAEKIIESAESSKKLTWQEKFDEIVSNSKKVKQVTPKKSDNAKINKEPNKKPLSEINKYKAPKLKKPAQFATKKLYQYIIKKMEPKFGIDTLVEAEQLVLSICDTVKIVTRRKAYQKKIVQDLKKEMARAGVIETTVDFYEFVIKFLPYNFRVKVVPCVQPVTNTVFPPKDVVNPFEKIL